MINITLIVHFIFMYIIFSELPGITDNDYGVTVYFLSYFCACLICLNNFFTHVYIVFFINNTHMKKFWSKVQLMGY